MLAMLLPLSIVILDQYIPGAAARRTVISRTNIASRPGYPASATRRHGRIKT